MKGNKGGIQKNAKGKTKIDYIFITIIVVEVIFIIILFTIPTIKDWLYKEFEYYWIAPLGTILVAIPSIYIINKRAKTAEKQVDTMIKQTENQTRQLEHELLKNGIEHLASENIAIRLGAIIELKGLNGTTIWEQAFNVLMSFVRTITKEEEYINKYVQIKTPKPREDIQAILDIVRDKNYTKDIPKVDLSGAQLAGANFSNAKLVYAIFYHANLQGASFSDAKLGSAYFNYANLQGASFSDAKLGSAYFNCANLQYASFCNAKFETGDFLYPPYYQAKLQYANFSNAEFKYSDFHDADLEGTIMIDVKGLDRESIKSQLANNTDTIIWTEAELKEALKKYPDKYSYLGYVLII